MQTQERKVDSFGAEEFADKANFRARIVELQAEGYYPVNPLIRHYYVTKMENSDGSTVYLRVPSTAPDSDAVVIY